MQPLTDEEEGVPSYQEHDTSSHQGSHGSTYQSCCPSSLSCTNLNRRVKAFVVISIAFIVITAIMLTLTVPVESTFGKERKIYIMAIETEWSYSNFKKATDPTFRKGIFVETDQTFTEIKDRPKKREHTGILGPIIHAEVGDVYTVHLKNNLLFPINIEPHGVRVIGEIAVADPGEVVEYTWEILDRSGPGSGDHSSIVWQYHSSVDKERDLASGLIGAIVVTRQGAALASSAIPADLDKEIFTLLGSFDESISHFRDVNHIDADCTDCKVWSINGFSKGTLPRLNIALDTHARWYLMAIGDMDLVMGAHWSGLVGSSGGRRMDTVMLLPGVNVVVDLEPDIGGDWKFHTAHPDMWAKCRVITHHEEGEDEEGEDEEDEE